MSRRSTSVVIASWNGRKILEQFLPPLWAALSRYRTPWEVMVVDDAGSDDTGPWLASNFPHVRFEKNPANIGNGPTLQRGAELARYDILYLMDNDVLVMDDFLPPLLEHFDDPTVFAVESRSIRKPPEPFGPHYIPRVRFRYGVFSNYYEPAEDHATRAVPVLFAAASQCAVDREKFFELGGFDPLYGRFYMEDVDLSYRAWKKGWKVLSEPRSRVFHQGSTTILNVVSRKGIERRQWRNRFLFTWKNIHSSSCWLQHLAFVLPEVLLMPFVGRTAYSIGFLGALPHLPAALRRRAVARREARVDDREIFRALGPLKRPPAAPAA
ncbi:MAG: glycosyltransferase [Nitrospirae bacterium]|nr:glycosyltransferase [Nitrospirota bacterium]